MIVHPYIESLQLRLHSTGIRDSSPKPPLSHPLTSELQIPLYCQLYKGFITPNHDNHDSAVMMVIMVMLILLQIHFSELGSLDRPGKGKSSNSGEFFSSQP